MRFKVGDWVVCENPENSRHLLKGGSYEVCEIVDYDDDRFYYLRLKDVPGGWDANRFLPLAESKQS